MAGRIAAPLLLLLALACAPATTPTGRTGTTAAPPAPGPTEAPSTPLQKLTVAIVAPTETMVIPWIAKETGIFVRQGFDAEVLLVTGTPRLVQSLIAGDFDYAIVGVTALMRARMQGAEPVILAATANHSTQTVMVHPQAGIQQLTDLRGRTVGVSQYGSEADTFLRIALSRVGLSADDVALLQTGGHPQTLAALVSGNLDAGVLGGAVAVAAQQAGMLKLADGRELNVLAPAGTLATTRRLIERDRDAVRRFMRAYVEGIHYFKTQRDEAIRIMQQHMGDLPADVISLLYDMVRDVYQPLPLPSEEAIQAVLDRETDPQARAFKPSDFLDVSFLREIEQSDWFAMLYR
ncbi:MAG TPA: ABC transporter substrate-binding protein [Chloroflexota bacterium]|nr:ABC transporter substrate-binding protein [Chloroflexota bacterium]